MITFKEEAAKMLKRVMNTLDAQVCAPVTQVMTYTIVS